MYATSLFLVSASDAVSSCTSDLGQPCPRAPVELNTLRSMRSAAVGLACIIICDAEARKKCLRGAVRSSVLSIPKNIEHCIAHGKLRAIG